MIVAGIDLLRLSDVKIVCTVEHSGSVLVDGRLRRAAAQG